MKRTLVRALPGMGLGLLLGACVQSSGDDAVRIMRGDADGVVLRGLIDATRTSPPVRYDTIAAQQCLRHGKEAVFAGMSQHSTFGFDVSYTCR